jgi:hypothetical protein
MKMKSAENPSAGCSRARSKFEPLNPETDVRYPICMMYLQDLLPDLSTWNTLAPNEYQQGKSHISVLQPQVFYSDKEKSAIDCFIVGMERNDELPVNPESVITKWGRGAISQDDETLKIVKDEQILAAEIVFDSAKGREALRKSTTVNQVTRKLTYTNGDGQTFNVSLTARYYFDYRLNSRRMELTREVSDGVMTQSKDGLSRDINIVFPSLNRSMEFVDAPLHLIFTAPAVESV